MTDETCRLEIAVADREALSLCLALGTLEAIRSGAWPAEAGIWTIARPCFWKSLENIGIPDDVLNVFRSADELDAIAKLIGAEDVDKTLIKWIGILHGRLAAMSQPSWHGRWC